MKTTRLLLIVLTLCVVTFAGCETMQWLRPHQLWKLNRQPAFGGEDGMFSIPPEGRPVTAN
jgi:hypothetical protein